MPQRTGRQNCPSPPGRGPAWGHWAGGYLRPAWGPVGAGGGAGPLPPPQLEAQISDLRRWGYTILPNSFGSTKEAKAMDILRQDRKRILGMPISFTNIPLTPRLVTQQKGLFTTVHDQVQLFRITDVRVTHAVAKAVRVRHADSVLFGSEPSPVSYSLGSGTAERHAAARGGGAGRVPGAGRRRGRGGRGRMSPGVFAFRRGV